MTSIRNLSAAFVPSLFQSGLSSGASFAATGVSADLLSGFYAGKSPAAGSTVTGRLYAPTAPWSLTAQPNPANSPELLGKAAREVMSGASLVNEDSAQLDLPNASGDYKKLFALYNGLNTLSQLAENARAKGVTASETAQLQKVFQRGVQEVLGYVETSRFDRLRLVQGEVNASTRAAAAGRIAATSYQTPPLVASNLTSASEALKGDVRFTLSITRIGQTRDIDIDLSSIPESERSLPRFVSFVNAQLEAEGLATRFETQRIPGQERTTTVGGRTVSLGKTPDSWALNLKMDTAEAVTLTPAATVPAIYIAQKAGNPDPDGKPSTQDAVLANQLLKFQTGAESLAPPDPPNAPTPLVGGQIWSKGLDSSLTSVRSMQTLADGSVLVLSDVTGELGGQKIRGDRDVVLQKFDSAGKLLFSRDLGASDEASGLSMAVADDGRIAIAGRIKGKLEGATGGSVTELKGEVSDSFVTVYNASGEEVWTQRRGSVGDDEATHLAWDSAGKLYVAGDSSSGRAGLSGLGQSDVFLETYETGADNAVTYSAATLAGGTGKDLARGLLIDGNNLYLASNESGSGVVRRFDLSSGAPELAATRSLGNLGGGDLVGLGMAGGRLVVAGNTWSGDLDAGNVVRDYSGGKDGFVARLSASLNPSGQDRLTYFGGAGEDTVTGVAIKADRVFLTGTSKADLPSLAKIGTVDGFVAEIDPTNGDIGWSRRFSGKDGFVAPSAIAVDTGGASVLDRLGLPTGAVNVADSIRLDAVSSVRVGDQLQVRGRLNGQKTTITVLEGDTLTTLAERMGRALAGQADVRVMTVDGGKRLQVRPLTARNVVELIAGPEGKDALKGLGLPEGVLRNTTVAKGGKLAPADGGYPIYGLKLNGKINLENSAEIGHAAAELAAAITVIRSAYRDLKDAATPASVKAAQAAPTAAVPAYMQKQIANYQEALAKLTGSG
ncbi:MAG: hypothetical protein RL588_1674 [Pseudomonadota bacterium]